MLELIKIPRRPHMCSSRLHGVSMCGAQCGVLVVCACECVCVCSK